MPIVTCKQTRRQFLVGAGKTLLALPLLPSLLPKEAWAQVAGSSRKMMIFWFDHNILAEFWPQRSIATTPVGSIGTREALLRTLPSMNAVSPVMSNALYNTLRMSDQISILRGLDVHGPGGHGFAPMGGNVVFDSGNIIQGPANYPTFDTFVEDSLSVYPLTTPSYVRKALRISFESPMSLRRVGTQVQLSPTYGGDSNQFDTSRSVTRFYNDVFSSLTGGTTNPQDRTNQLKTNILNRVFPAFQSFRANRRISSDDRARLDQHMAFLSDIQRSFSSSTGGGNTCTAPGTPTASTNPLIHVGLYMDLLAVAFKCGLTKFGMMSFQAHDPQWLPGLALNGLGVHGAFHGEYGLVPRHNAYESFHRWGLNNIADRFLAHMNEPEGSTGRTYLQNMATLILHQAGMEYGAASSHTSADMQQIIIGSMGGVLRSGRYFALPESNEANRRRLPYNSYIISLLRMMGVQPSEYASSSNTGQGWGYYDPTPGHPFASHFNSHLADIFT